MKIISSVFHPLMIATLLSGLLITQAPELLPRIRPEASLQFILVIFLITAIMPAISVFLLRSFKYISNLELTRRRERIIPFIFIFFYYAIAAYLFIVKLEMGFLFITVITSVTLLIFLLLLITLRFKISIHASAIWSAVGYVTAILLTLNVSLGLSYYGLIIIAGITSMSRLYLGYHTPKEVWSGSILGFAYSFLVIMTLF